LLALSSFSATALAIRPNGVPFYATMYGTYGEYKHFWIDKDGAGHLRSAPYTQTIEGSGTKLDGCTIDATVDADALPGVGGDYRMWGKITLAGDDSPSYTLEIHGTLTWTVIGTVAGWALSGPFMIEGHGELITGVVTATLGAPATLTGTYWA
jgi:hypothetical protein